MNLCWLNYSDLSEIISYNRQKNPKQPNTDALSVQWQSRSAVSQKRPSMKKSQSLAEFPVYHLCITPQNCLGKSLCPKAFLQVNSKQPQQWKKVSSPATVEQNLNVATHRSIAAPWAADGVLMPAPPCKDFKELL